jgi:hypothetical protein
MLLDALRAATNGGWALGDASFERQLAGASRRCQEADRAASVPPNRSSLI